MDSFVTPSRFRFIKPGFGNMEMGVLSRPPNSSPLFTSADRTPSRPLPGTPYSEGSSPASSRAASPSGSSPGSEAGPFCQCQRKMHVIMCCSCGFTFKGRIRKSCPLHPNSIYLMDIDSCPECNSERIREYQQFSV